MVRVFSVFCLLAVLLTAAPGLARAAPVVVIHDRVDIEMEPVRRFDGRAYIRGRLIERASGEPAARVRVRVRLDALEASTRTDDSGQFSHMFHLDGGQHLLAVDFAGDEVLDPAHFEIAGFDINKSPLALSLSLPGLVEDVETEARARISARSGDRGVALAIDAYMGAAGEDLRKFATIQTNDEGEASFALDDDLLNGPGRKRFEIRYRGDHNLDSAIAGATLHLRASSSLSLTIEQREYDYGDTLVARGRVTDGRGDALANAVIGLEISSQRIANATSDERGDYVMRIDTEEIGSGITALQAVYLPTESWNSASHSEPVSVNVGERKPIPIAYTLAAFALSSMALLSFVGLRTRPWQRWLARKGAEGEEAASAPAAAELVVPTGLAPAPRKLSSSLRRASYRDLRGVVRNALDQTPIPNADLALHELGEMTSSRSFSADADGRFTIAELPEGSHRVRASAAGFVSEIFGVEIPHRGEFHDASVRLLPVKEKIFMLYKDAVRGFLPDQALWGIWTPRQILDHVRKSQPSECLSDLTDSVEETFFSQRTPSEDMLPLVEGKIRAAREEEAAALASQA